MNMFRDITIFALMGLGFGLLFTDPDTWNWATVGGAYLVQAIAFLSAARPFSPIICFALALALFMTRLKY